MAILFCGKSPDLPASERESDIRLFKGPLVGSRAAAQECSPRRKPWVAVGSVRARRLQALDDQYKANPDKGTLARIQSVIGDINQNLPALLQAARISDPALSARGHRGCELNFKHG